MIDIDARKCPECGFIGDADDFDCLGQPDNEHDWLFCNHCNMWVFGDGTVTNKHEPTIFDGTT